MLISEIFLSIQGESTYAGMPCIFIRLAGCNLSCSWCDTPYARVPDGARDASVDEVVSEIKKYRCDLVEITGGEPLMQQDACALAKRLVSARYTVLIETNGSVCLEGLDQRVVKIVDVKCPGSGHGGSFLMENLKHISPDDELKFVIGSRVDYEYAARFVEECVRDKTLKILFAPVAPSLDPRELAGWILRDCLKVRLQIQMHKYIWADERGR